MHGVSGCFWEIEVLFCHGVIGFDRKAMPLAAYLVFLGGFGMAFAAAAMLFSRR